MVWAYLLVFSEFCNFLFGIVNSFRWNWNCRCLVHMRIEATSMKIHIFSCTILLDFHHYFLILIDFWSKYVWPFLIKIVFLQKSIKYKDDSHTDSVLGLAWNKEYRFVELKLDSAFIFSVGCFLEPKSLYTHTHTLLNSLPWHLSWLLFS